MATFTGTEGADVITQYELSPGVISTPIRTGTSSGNDVIYGRGGDDRIDAGFGNDHAEGGTGSDQIYGNQGDDYVAGDHGDDWLIGGEGDDDLNGGSGADRMDGWYGDDSYLVDDAGDVVTERAEEGSDAVESYLADYTLTDHVEHLILSENFARNGSGNGLGNTILGNSFDNVINGFGGADFLAGGVGHDILRGGNGGDALIGGDGVDVLRGQAGVDDIMGKDGADALIGGAGADRFHFEFVTDSTPGRRDVIRAGDGATAFQGAGAAVGDTIHLGGIDANALTLGANEAFILGGVGTGRLSLVNSGGNTIVRGNTDADAAFELEIVIEDGGVLASAYSAADFYV